MDFDSLKVFARLFQKAARCRASSPAKRWRMMKENCEILEGILSVKAAISGRSRKIYEVYVDSEKYRKRDRKVMSFLTFLTENGIRAQMCEREVIDSFVASFGEGAGNTHGGVAAAVGERKTADVSEVLLKVREENGFCVYLDGVEDPFNLGYAIRCLYACGASGIILPRRDRSGMTSVMARSSAGASELVLLSELSDSDKSEARLAFTAKCDKAGIHRACAAVSGASTPIYDYASGFPLILFIGGEKRGISPEFMEGSEILHIPYASPDIRYSLPSASVAAIMGAELMRIKNSL